MKKNVLGTTLFAVGLALLPVSSYALPTAGEVVKLYNGTGNTRGGEFKVDLQSNGYGTDYLSFCLERSETISFNTPYTIASVADYAELGGGGAVGGKDYVSAATKWLYDGYMFGNYSWSRSTGLTTQKANAVQNTIWYLEDEFTMAQWNNLSTSRNASYNLLEIVLAQSDYSISSNVKVLNLVDRNGRYRQSQLVGEPVPEPSTMLLLGTGLAALGGVARRKRKG